MPHDKQTLHEAFFANADATSMSIEADAKKIAEKFFKTRAFTLEVDVHAQKTMLGYLIGYEVDVTARLAT